MAGEFVDSNVLLYLTSADAAKATRAERVLARGLVVSVQVLNEIANVSRRKFKRAWPEIADLLDQLKPLLDVHDLTEAMHLKALAIVQQQGFSWWDALIVAAALETGCDTLYSEDMHAGLRVDGQLTIINPFA